MLSDDFLPAATGVGIHVQRVSRDLTERGHRVSIITSRRPGEPEEEIWHGVRVYRTFTLKVFGFYQALPSQTTIRRILTENAVQLVHHHYLGILLVRAERVARALALPQVYTYHMTVDHLTQPWPMKPFRPVISRQIVKYGNRFDLVIVPALDLVEKVKADGVRTPVRHISNPVVFEGTAQVQPAARPASFMVLYAGRLNPEKNIPLLLQAFSELLGDHPDSGLWIAGTGDQRERLETMCRTLGIAGRVRFLGFLEHEELARHYAACDVFVLPSLVETQGLVAMEAMHFARPIVVTRAIVSARELVEEGINGYIVDSERPAELADRLRTLAGAPALRERLGRAGLDRSRAYAPEGVAAAVEGAYQHVLKRPRHPL
jgi:glycosyltransferase involved in cell wall biosynthesis